MSPQEAARGEVRHCCSGAGAMTRTKSMREAGSQVQARGHVQDCGTRRDARLRRVVRKIGLSSHRDVKDKPGGWGALQLSLHLMWIPMELRVVFVRRECAGTRRIWIEE